MDDAAGHLSQSGDLLRRSCAAFSRCFGVFAIGHYRSPEKQGDCIRLARGFQTIDK
ncbi:MAG: hypothetical protein ABIO86_06380 [Sphingomonas sp.]